MDLTESERAWDEADVDEMRNVAWLALLTVAYDIEGSFSSEGFVGFTMRNLAERGRTTGLVGAALVCGDMESERRFFEDTPHVSFTTVDGFDLSQTSLDRYSPRGITWRPFKSDCNKLDLVPGAYDFIIAHHGAHHVRNLDEFFSQARRALKPGGLMFIHEWIGPTYLQIPRRNRLVATILLYLLFPRRWMRTTHTGKVKGVRYIQDPPESFDPSEACNSLGLYPAFIANFRPLSEYKHSGLTYPMFEGLAQVVASDQRRNPKRVRLVVRIERWLTHKGLLAPLFVVALAEARP